jgi:hypothetical protein
VPAPIDALPPNSRRASAMLSRQSGELSGISIAS